MHSREVSRASNKYFYRLHRRDELSHRRERQQTARIWPINYFNLCFRVLYSGINLTIRRRVSTSTSWKWRGLRKWREFPANFQVSLSIYDCLRNANSTVTERKPFGFASAHQQADSRERQEMNESRAKLIIDIFFVSIKANAFTYFAMKLFLWFWQRHKTHQKKLLPFLYSFVPWRNQKEAGNEAFIKPRFIIGFDVKHTKSFAFSSLLIKSRDTNQQISVLCWEKFSISKALSRQ